jgi:putative Mn2+ efflux pump MntP
LTWWYIAGIAVGLAMDAFAVAIAAGIKLAPVTKRQTFRLAFHFGLFQAMMPMLGWLAGSRIAGHIQAEDHWVAFGLLGYVGLKMLWESRSDKPAAVSDPTRGWMLVSLSIATSIDALAVGLSMALLAVAIWLPALVIGLVAAAFTTAGILGGSRLGKRWGRTAEAVGGCVLLAIGVKVLVDHLMF